MNNINYSELRAMNREINDNNLSETGKKWIFNNVNNDDVIRLSLKYGLSELAASIALLRMDNIEEADDIFACSIKNNMPDPDLLPDSELGYDFLYDKIINKQKIAVWGDYDADGACSSAIVIRYFRSIGIEIDFYISDRFKEGYGPNKHGLQKLLDNGIKTLIIVDCGTTSFAALDWAKEQQMEVMIIDHHQTGARFPACDVFINPKRDDYTGPSIFPLLCAGGMVFVFLVGFNRYLRNKGFFNEDRIEPNLSLLLDLVALSTVCDMVPLKGLNRAFVKQGIKVINNKLNSGIKALIDLIRIDGNISINQLGYTIGPRINAGGRIGDSKIATKLLACDNYNQAFVYANELNTLNQERQKIEKEIEEKAYAKALLSADKPYIILSDDSWHEGVMGIIAGRIKDVFNKPSIVLTKKDDILKGSVRSVPGIDIGYMLNEAYSAGHLLSGGGHQMAGGLSLKYEKYDDLLNFIDNFFLFHRYKTTVPQIYIDKTITLKALKNHDFIKAIASLEPFGVANPMPKFFISNVRFDNIMYFGQNHLRMKAIQMGDSYPITYFRSLGKEIGDMLLAKQSTILDCVVSITIENRLGLSKINLILEDIKYHTPKFNNKY